MRRTSALLSLVIALAMPAAAFGQFPGSGPGGRMGGMGGRGRGGFGRGGGNGAPAALPSNAEIEQRDPIVLLMQKRKDLTLADSQFTKLTQIDAALMDRNRPLMAELDSIRAAGPAVPSGDTTSGERSAGGIDRRGFMGVYREIERNNDAAVQEALATFTNDQQKVASRLLDDQRKEIEKASGGGRFRGLRGPGRGAGGERGGPPEGDAGL